MTSTQIYRDLGRVFQRACTAFPHRSSQHSAISTQPKIDRKGLSEREEAESRNLLPLRPRALCGKKIEDKSSDWVIGSRAHALWRSVSSSTGTSNSKRTWVSHLWQAGNVSCALKVALWGRR
jgi:hypothetical protein